MRAIRNRAQDVLPYVFLAISLVLGPLLARLFLVAVRIRVEGARSRESCGLP